MLMLFIFKIFEWISSLFYDFINKIVKKNMIDTLFGKNKYEEKHLKFIKNKYKKNKIKIGLLTNEIPPIVYGGVATWIVNFIKMFENDENMEVVPIFLAHQDDLPEECYEKYKNIRVVDSKENLKSQFNDIDICFDFQCQKKLRTKS